MDECTTVDTVVAILATAFAVIVFVTVVREFHSSIAFTLVFLFMLYTVNHLAIVVFRDTANDWPQVWTVLVPVAIAMFLVLLFKAALWLAFSLVTIGLVYMIAHTLGAVVSGTITLIVALLLCFTVRMCAACKDVSNVTGFGQTILVTMTSAFLIVTGALALVKMTNSTFANHEDDNAPCPDTANKLLLCDFKCASITSESNPLWLAAWSVPWFVIVCVRLLIVKACNWKNTQECCARSQGQRYSNLHSTTATQMVPIKNKKNTRLNLRELSSSAGPDRPYSNEEMSV